jgi:hypothetical protein
MAGTSKLNTSPGGSSGLERESFLFNTNSDVANISISNLHQLFIDMKQFSEWIFIPT